MNKIVKAVLEKSNIASNPSKIPQKDNAELKTRILSALVLAPIAIGLAYFNFATFLILITIFIVALSWEWGKMTRSNGVDHITFLTIMTALTMMGAIVWKDLALIWGILSLGGLAVYFLSLEKRLWSLAGVFYIALPAGALVWLRADPTYGFAAIVFVLFVVWTTDSASYFVGRLIGGVKFAPTLSPNKTWSGFLGGVIAAAMMGGIFSLWLDSAPKTLAVVAFMIAVASQYGDLLESSIKRHYGIKDSSQLIPGHGGAFDRLDGLLMAVLMAGLIAFFRDASAPAQSLLIW